MSNLEEKLKSIKIKDTLARESHDSNWSSLESKYFNYYNNKMLPNSSPSGKILSARPKWLTALIISGIVLVVAAIPVSAYFAIPTVKETVNNILKIETVKKGTLVVEPSTPTDVSVFLNGEYQGNTPYTTTLPVGSYTVRLYKVGYEEKFITVNIVDGQPYYINDGLISTTADPYQGWLTYRNDTLGFGFRYPSNWEISENTDGTSHVINLSYTKADSKETAIAYTLTYESKNSNAYNANNLKIEESYNDSIGAVKILTRKVGDTVVDTLSVVLTKSLEVSQLTNKELSYKDMFVDSVSFVNKTKTDSSTTTNSSTTTDPVLYKSAVLVAAPYTSSGNYLLTDDIVNSSIRVLNVNTKTVKDFAYSIPRESFITDPSGKFVIYSQNSVAYAMDLATGKAVELFRGKSDNTINFSFAFDSISPDSNYLIYRVTIHDISKCAQNTSDGECFGDMLDEKYGWKTGIYIYDLSGNMGNTYLDSQPFDKSFYDNNVYTVDWANGSATFYIEDVSHGTIYKYSFKKVYFISMGSSSVGSDYWSIALDMWGDGRYSSAANVGILMAAPKGAGSNGYELWKVTDNGGDTGVNITKVAIIGHTMLPTSFPYGFKIISLNGKPYAFFTNTVWMYSLLDGTWQAHKYLGGDFASGSEIHFYYYPTNIANTVMAVEVGYGGQESRGSASYITLFDPLALTVSKQFSFTSATAPHSLGL